MSGKVTVKISDFTGGVNYRYDESVLPPSTASDCYNFDFSSGVLSDGYGIVGVDFMSGIAVKKVFYYTRYDHDGQTRDDQIIGVSVTGEVYSAPVLNPSNIKKWQGITLSGEPTFVNYRLYGEDVVIISTASDGMLIYNGVSEPYFVESAPTITSMALHYERLFVTVDGEKNSVWFSDDLDPTNWDSSLDGGGFIQMIDERGAVNRVISYLGYLYAFRDYGITRITAYGDQTDFMVSNLFVSSGKIYPSSVVNCGDRVVFLADDGLYSFDGVSASKILPHLSSLVKNGEKAVGVYANGKYYLAFNREQNSEIVGDESENENGNNGLLILDINSGEYSLSRGLIINSLSQVNGKAVACDRTGRVGEIVKCGENFGEPLKKKWRLPKSDWGKQNRKTVRQITLFSATDITLTLYSDKRSSTVKIKGKSEVQKKRVCFSGLRIGLDIESNNSGVKISRPTISASVSGV